MCYAREAEEFLPMSIQELQDEQARITRELNVLTPVYSRLLISLLTKRLEHVTSMLNLKLGGMK